MQLWRLGRANSASIWFGSYDSTYRRAEDDQLLLPFTVSLAIYLFHHVPSCSGSTGQQVVFAITYEFKVASNGKDLRLCPHYEQARRDIDRYTVQSRGEALMVVEDDYLVVHKSITVHGESRCHTNKNDKGLEWGLWLLTGLIVSP